LDQAGLRPRRDFIYHLLSDKKYNRIRKKNLAMNIGKSLSGLMRVPFLILTPACVAVGIGTAYWQTGELNWLNVALVFIGALAAHMSVNTFNEYFDFKSGLDHQTRRTPFSGGSGTLPANPQMARVAFLLALATFGIVAMIGVYFVWVQGWQLLPIGILGLILIVTYTVWWVYYPVLCLIAPGLGFGVLMVTGTHFALTGSYSWSALIASLVPTFLVSDLLLLNQFPDMEADREVGRRHFPITIGRKASSLLYGIFLGLAYTSVVVGVLLKLLPVFSLVALLTSVIAWRTYREARQNAENIPALIPSMGMNVMIILATPILLALGLLVS
jgi:1,4-dihydroxy-2-naphthoate octaprenyltransferase